MTGFHYNLPWGQGRIIVIITAEASATFFNTKR